MQLIYIDMRVGGRKINTLYIDTMYKGGMENSFMYKRGWQKDLNWDGLRDTQPNLELKFYNDRQITDTHTLELL